MGFEAVHAVTGGKPASGRTSCMAAKRGDRCACFITGQALSVSGGLTMPWPAGPPAHSVPLRQPLVSPLPDEEARDATGCQR